MMAEVSYWGGSSMEPLPTGQWHTLLEHLLDQMNTGETSRI